MKLTTEELSTIIAVFDQWGYEFGDTVETDLSKSANKLYDRLAKELVSSTLWPNEKLYTHTFEEISGELLDI